MSLISELSKTTEAILFFLLLSTTCLKLDAIINWHFIEIFWPFWMYVVLLFAIGIIVLIFAFSSIKSYIHKKTPFKHLLFSFIILIFIVLYVALMINAGSSIVYNLDQKRSKVELKKPFYFLLAWYILVYCTIALGKKNVMYFLYKTVFVEEVALDEEGEDSEEEGDDRKKAYKKKNIDVKEVPNFVQKFTSTYFKIKPNFKRVNYGN